MEPTINRKFAEFLLDTFDDPGRHGVHLLFNRFWRTAPPEVVEAYVAPFRTDPALVTFVRDGYFADPIEVDRLAGAPPGSLGAAAHEFIVGNGLEDKLATNYREFHESLVASGALDGMPEELHYAILRGFQLHDFLHVMSGYGPSPGGEIALQSFCLAQLRFPYFAMWISVVTTRMALLAPGTTVSIMDHVSQGWQFGRAAANIQLERWEDHLDEPLADLRLRFGIHPDGRRAADATTTVVDLDLATTDGSGPLDVTVNIAP